MQRSSQRRRARKPRHTNGRVALPDALLIFTVCIVAFVSMLAIVSVIGWLMESVWHAAMVLAGLGALLSLRRKLHRMRRKRTTEHMGHATQTTSTVPPPPVLSRAPNKSTMPPKSRSDTAKQDSIVYWGKQRVGWMDEAGRIYLDRSGRSMDT